MNKNKQYYNYYFSHNDIFATVTNLATDFNTTDTVFLIAHVCNNVGVFGGGFAKDLAEHFPLVKENFLALGKKEAKLGRVQYVEVYCNNKTKNKIIVANMIAQNGTMSNKNMRPLNYGALVYCMNNINNYISSLMHSNIENIQIHCPKFGSGLAGGNWLFIQDLIRDVWASHNVCIYNKKNMKLSTNLIKDKHD